MLGTVDEYRYSSTNRRREIGYFGSDASILFYSMKPLLELYPPTLKESFYETSKLLEDSTSHLSYLNPVIPSNPAMLRPDSSPVIFSSKSVIHIAAKVTPLSEFEGDTLDVFDDSYQYESEDETTIFPKIAGNKVLMSPIDAEDEEFGLVVQMMRINGHPEEEIRKKKIDIARQRAKEAFGVTSSLPRTYGTPSKIKSSPDLVKMVLHHSHSYNVLSSKGSSSSPDGRMQTVSSAVYLNTRSPVVAETPDEREPNIDQEVAEFSSCVTRRLNQRFNKKSLAWNSDEDEFFEPSHSRTMSINQYEPEPYDGNDIEPDDLSDAHGTSISYDDEDIGFVFEHGGDTESVGYISDEDATSEDSNDEKLSESEESCNFSDNDSDISNDNAKARDL